MSIAIDAESHAELRRQIEQCEADGSRMADEIERLKKELRYLVHTDEDIKVQNAEIERLRVGLLANGCIRPWLLGSFVDVTSEPINCAAKGWEKPCWVCIALWP